MNEFPFRFNVILQFNLVRASNLTIPRKLEVYIICEISVAHQFHFVIVIRLVCVVTLVAGCFRNDEALVKQVFTRSNVRHLILRALLPGVLPQEASVALSQVCSDQIQWAASQPRQISHDFLCWSAIRRCRIRNNSLYLLFYLMILVSPYHLVSTLDGVNDVVAASALGPVPFYRHAY